MKNFYPSLILADEVLDYYEDYLLKCRQIIYIAVVENKKKSKSGLNQNGYCIEIGIKSDEAAKVNFDEHNKLSPLEIYFGDFDECTIPAYFPIPSDFRYTLKSILNTNTLFLSEIISMRDSSNSNKIDELKDTLFNKEKTSNITAILNFVDHENDNKETIYMEGDSKLDRSTKKTSNKNNGVIDSYNVLNQIGAKPMTLGGIFRILEFPNELFGITNQHLFDYKQVKLGDQITTIDGKIIGELFWMCEDLYREAAIVKIDQDFFDKPEEYNDSIILSSPELNMKVTHNGFGSETSVNRNSTIISKNATVRIYESDDGENWKIFKNQILIDVNTTPGDSGSLVITENKKVVGLNFGKTYKRKVVGSENKYRSLSVANNINLILNHKFCQKQEILSKKKKITTRLTKEFRIKTLPNL